MKIVLIGAPGAGKGVYAQYFRDRYCIPHISTGDIFREVISSQTDLGLKIKPYVEKGLLVPDEIVIEIIRERLSKPDTVNGFILDGFPRTINQAKALEDITRIDAVIHLVVSEEVAVRRLSGRVICPVCGRVYNLYYEPKPKFNEQCDIDGARLIKRKDDEPGVVKERYRVFYETFTPVIEYYRDKRLLIEVNADKSIKDIAPLLEQLLIDNKILRLKPCKEISLSN
ncbi:MAG: adenylate kinase [Desulfurococcaceae archaeon]